MNEIVQESSLSDFEAARNKLRQRWELASVLNFFKVFEPVIESNLKISAEEIETALILPNKSLAQIHISLLKGIPPVNKNLKDPDAWVVSLSKKLVMWWPWVANGDFPLTTTKGAEMSKYKELDPTVRLVILKALCEIRADQHDVVSYINDGVRIKNEMSTFRKNNIGEDGKGTSYWCDGDEIIGFRLYQEVNTFNKNETQTTWKTLATNLEEFQKVVDEYSSSKSTLEVAVSGVIENEVIPVLDKLQKKKQKALQKKMKEERIMNNFCRVGITRSCRSSRPISYTFDEYDKAINEAIRETKKMKTKEEQKSQKKETVVMKEDSEEEEDDHHQPIDDESTESDSDSSKLESKDVSEDNSGESDEESHENDDDNNDENNDDDDDEDEEKNGNDSSEDGVAVKSEIENGGFVGKTRGSKKDSENGGDGSSEEMRNFGAKKRLRQRPNRNTAIESAIVPDSEDETSSGNSDS